MLPNCKKIIAIVLLSILIIFPAGNCYGFENVGLLPYCISVTFNGDAESCRALTWYTDQKCTSNLLLVEATCNELPNFKSARLYQGSNRPMERHTGWESLQKQVTVHQLTLTDLKADTSYAFKVGDARLGIWSETGTFHTAARNEAFRFIVVADSQGEDEEDFRRGAQTLHTAMSQLPKADFMVHMGDFVESYGSEGSFENFAQWQQFFTTARSALMNTTLLPVAGNHDLTENVFASQFLLDKLMPVGCAAENGVYYAMDYGNTCFIVLNSNEGYQNGTGTISEQQVDWLKNAAAAADQRGARWKILLLHRGIYSFGRHMDSPDIVALRSQLAPIISDLGIDLVLQGHDHVYMRSGVLTKRANGKINPVAEPIKHISENDQGQNVVFAVNPAGTTYITPNLSGTKFGCRKISSLIEVYPAAAYHPEDNNEPVFAEITIDGNRLIYRAYVYEREKPGQVKEIDRYAILKQDHTAPNSLMFVLPGSSPVNSSGAAIRIEELWKLLTTVGPLHRLYPYVYQSH